MNRFALTIVFLAPVVGACSSSSGGANATAGGGAGGSGGSTSGAGGTGGTSTAGGAGAAGSAGSAGNATAGDAGSGGAGAAGSGAGGAGNAGSGGTGMPVLLDCDTRSATGATVVDAAIDADQSWSGHVYVNGQIDVGSGAKLTIAAGTEIVMAAGSSLTFGASTPATLLAQGTLAQPIRFCGEQAQAGFWGGVKVSSGVTVDSALHNVLVSEAGGSPEALVLDAPLSVDNLQIRASGGDGVRAVDFKSGSAGLWVEGSSGAALVLTSASAATHFPLGGTLSGNTDNTAHLRFATVDADSTFPALGVPYVQEATLAVGSGATLSIDAGVEYRVADGALLDVATDGSAAGLSIKGTSAAPVVLRGVTASPGAWQGIIFRASASGDSLIANAQIRHAGASSVGPLYVLAPVHLQDVKLDSNLIGAYIGGQGLAADSKNLSITTTMGVPLHVVPNGLVSLPQGGDFTGNTTDQIVIDAGAYTAKGTVPNLGIPYRVLYNFVAQDGAQMALPAGTQFIAGGGVSIDFGSDGTGARIVASGTSAAPVRFTGFGETAGFWQGLSVGTNVGGSSLDYVEVSDGTDACLSLLSAIPVTHSKFSDCQGYGILKAASDTSDYTVTNTFSNVGSGGIGNLP